MINLYPNYWMHYDMAAEDDGKGGDSGDGGDDGGDSGDSGYEAPLVQDFTYTNPEISIENPEIPIETSEIPIWIIEEMQRCSDVGGSWDYGNS